MSLLGGLHLQDSGDPWVDALLAPSGSPARADAAAAAPSMDLRCAGLARWLLVRAARDGSTWLPATVLLPALAALEVTDPPAGLQAALGHGAVAELEDGALALPELALAEEEAAEQVERLLVTEGSVALRTGPPTPELDAGADVTQVHLLGLPELASALEQVEDGARVVLSGDDQVLQAGPGQVLRDLLRTGLPRTEVEPPTPASALELLRSEVRRGVLPAPQQLQTEDRAVVVVPVESDAEAVTRVTQLVQTSIPRAFGLDVGEMAVLTPRPRGQAGANALAAALSCPVSTIRPDLSPAQAVVLVLPPSAAGSLARPLLLTALHAAQRHVSIVTGVGAALPRAVAQGGRPRRTRLAALLADGL